MKLRVITRTIFIQIITGIFLSVHYTPNTELAFISLIHITQNVNWGWLLHNFDINGASLFILCLYIHIGRGIYYFSYHLKETWNVGVTIFTCVSYAEAHNRYRLDVRLSVRLSHAGTVSKRLTERIVMISSPHDKPFILVLCVPRSSRNSDGVTPCGGAKYRWGIKIVRFSN